MSKILDKIKNIISSSNISAEDQNDLLIFLPILPEPAMEDLCEIFIKDPKMIKEFNEDFKSRLKILIDGRDQWDKLIEKESSMLEEEEQF